MSTFEFIEAIANNELENLSKVIAKEANPFAALGRASDIYYVFAGRTDDRSEYNQKSQWYDLKIPYNESHGILSYLLGIPSQLIYTLIPSLFMLATWGVGFAAALGFALIIAFVQEAPALLSLITLPLWLPLLIAFGAATFAFDLVGVGAIIAYGITKSALYIVNLLIQKLLIPALSGLFTAITWPFIKMIELYYDSRAYREHTIVINDGNTLNIFEEFGISSRYVNINTTPEVTTASSNTQTPAISSDNVLVYENEDNQNDISYRSFH